MGNKPIGSAIVKALAAGILHDHVPWYRRRWTNRFRFNMHKKGKYSEACQGKRECARRLRQIESGIIQKDQCL